MIKVRFIYPVTEYLDLEFTSEKEGSEILDTEVRLINYNMESTKSYIALISGSQIDNFVKDFKALFPKYAI